MQESAGDQREGTKTPPAPDVFCTDWTCLLLLVRLKEGIYSDAAVSAGVGEVSSRCGQAAEQPGPAVSEPGQVRRGGVLLQTSSGDLRVQTGS